ncbi:MAG: ARMT1-like domain-containing protein [Candidatus Eremiobacteraeota bacterium]|nr:ARMT1-like domain-containing protein [Candidatus Eremiobacteraeota bacterium]
MNTSIDCLQCLFPTLVKLIKIATDDEDKRMEIVRGVLERLSKDPLNENPVAVSERLMSYVREVSGNHDPLKKLKHERNQKAWKLLPEISRIIHNSEDPLFSSFKAAAAGNILDIVSVGNDAMLESALKQAFNNGFARNDYNIFLEQLDTSENILYIGDNSGEIVLDRFPVSELVKRNKKILYCVRGEPAMDDALEADFIEAKMGEFAEMIDTGTPHLGFLPDKVSQKTKEIFNEADLIISKGMGNYESLYEINDKRIYFILRAKCDYIAEKMRVKKGDYCFTRGGF